MTIGSVFKELDIDQICYTALLQSLCQFLIICPLKKRAIAHNLAVSTAILKLTVKTLRQATPFYQKSLLKSQECGLSPGLFVPSFTFSSLLPSYKAKSGLQTNFDKYLKKINHVPKLVMKNSRLWVKLWSIFLFSVSKWYVDAGILDFFQKAFFSN